MTEDRFGKIKIESGTPGENVSDVPLDQEKIAKDSIPSSQIDVASSTSRPAKKGRGVRRGPSFTLPLPSKKIVAWFSLIPFMVLLYGVGSYFLVPVILKGPFAAKLARDTGRPIEMGRVVFSPFTLQLLINEGIVGPQQGSVSRNDLLYFENARFDFSLKKIIKGKFMCSKALIDGIVVNLVRQMESNIDLKSISNFFLSRSSGQQLEYWPAWFLVDEIRIADGKIHIEDRVAKKDFTVEQIQVYLPSAETREHDKAAVPQMSAVVDSSPFEINAVRLQNQTGAWSTGFSFEFRSVILNKFRDILPFPESGLQLADGEADMVLDFILPEIQHGTEGVVVEGETTLKNIQWQDPETQAIMTVPEGRVVYRIVPSEKLFQFTNVEFHEPEIILNKTLHSTNNNPHTYLLSVIEKIFHAEESMKVENFLLDNGKIVLTDDGKAGKRTLWNDVTFRLSGFATYGHRIVHPASLGPVKYSLRVRDTSTKPVAEINTDGELINEAILKGQLKITGIELKQYLDLLPRTDLILQQGKANISLDYEYSGFGNRNKINDSDRSRVYNGMFKTTGFVLKKNKAKALSGEVMTCGKFHVEMKSRAIVCDQLELYQSEIHTGRIFRKNVQKSDSQKSGWGFWVNSLKVVGSSIHLPLKDTGKDNQKRQSTLVVHNVSLEASNLNSEKVADNVKMDGKVGKKGALAIQGSYSHRTGQGALQVDIKDVELSLMQPYFSSWFVPALQRGTFGASGNLILPDRVFKGHGHIDNLEAGKGSEAKVSWKKMYSGNLLYKADPEAIDMKELVIQQPSFQSGLSSGEGPLDNYLNLPDEKLPASVRIGLIRVVNGTFEMPEPVIYPGYQPLLQNVNGTIALTGENGHAFILDGRMEGQSSFKIQGAGSFHSISSYKLEMQDFSLRTFDSVLIKNAGFSGQNSTVSWKQQKVVEDSLSKVETVLSFQDIAPDFSKPTVTLLSLLLNNDKSFEMVLNQEYQPGTPQPFFLEQFLTRLKKLQVKAALSPKLVLQSTIPLLELVQNVVFAPGEAVLDTSISFSGYQELFSKRPFVKLSLQGKYDSVRDHDMIQAELQKDADQKRETENKRRAIEKEKIIQREKEKLKMLPASKDGRVVEELIPVDSDENLQPLPMERIKVAPTLLKQLAQKRAEILREYFVGEMNLDPNRVAIDPEQQQGGHSVQITIIPYEPTITGMNDDS